MVNRRKNTGFEDLMITDLKERLSNHREFVPPLEGIALEYGMNTNTLNKWLDKWLNEYDFKAREAYLNQFPIYKTNIQGMDIAYIRIAPEVPEGKELVPLLLVHGWPNNFDLFYEIIPLLTAVSDDRDFVVDLIVPCLPGFGYSEGAVRPGLGSAQMAVVLRNLMHRIGYKKFYIQGGDLAAHIFPDMATIFPDEVLGYHTNWGLLLSPVAVFLQMVGQLYPPLVLSNQTLYSRMYPLQTIFNGVMEFTGYFHVHATKPDTLGIALTDSPAGLASWILEKLATAAHPSNMYLEDGGLENVFTDNQLLDLLTIFWSTKSIQTSVRPYSDTFNKNRFSMRLDEIPTNVPLWAIQAVDELIYQPAVILGLKWKNIIKTDVWDEGGHYIVIEYPERFSQSILDGLAGFREWHAANGTDTTLV